MKFCVVGAGAIGGLLAARLAAAGETVSVVARGANLAAIAARGLTLVEEDGTRLETRPQAVQHLADLPPQDVVILGMKAHQVIDVVDELPKVFHDGTMVVTAQNGIPWWYFLGQDGPFAGRTIEAVDPGGRIAAALPVARVIGTVVYPAAELSEPGVIRHIEGNRFSLGEVDNSSTPRIAALSEALRQAGFKAPVVSDIRAEIWMKLWGNLSFNPVSALTHATLVDMCRDPGVRSLIAGMMTEARSIGEALGIRFRMPIDKRIAGAEAIGAHKTSMLQDIEAGKAVELDALLGAVMELGRLTNVATPLLDSVFAMVALLSRQLAMQRGRLRVEPL